MPGNFFDTNVLLYVASGDPAKADRAEELIGAGGIISVQVLNEITNNAEVEDTSGHPIPGLYAAGEIAGGLFYHNYASGTGLMSGAVFGRIAGRSAAAHAGSLD